MATTYQVSFVYVQALMLAFVIFLLVPIFILVRDIRFIRAGLRDYRRIAENAAPLTIADINTCLIALRTVELRAVSRGSKETKATIARLFREHCDTIWESTPKAARGEDFSFTATPHYFAAFTAILAPIYVVMVILLAAIGATATFTDFLRAAIPIVGILAFFLGLQWYAWRKAPVTLDGRGIHYKDYFLRRRSCLWDAISRIEYRPPGMTHFWVTCSNGQKVFVPNEFPNPIFLPYCALRRNENIELTGPLAELIVRTKRGFAVRHGTPSAHHINT